MQSVENMQSSGNIANAMLAAYPYRKLDALDKKYKPLILKWLSGLFGYENYPHSFKDQWITWNIWDGELSVSFDLRQEEQVRLLSLIHPRFLGCPQYKTLKVVNEKSFYLQLKQLLYIEYPGIKGSKKISQTKHKDNDNSRKSLRQILAGNLFKITTPMTKLALIISENRTIEVRQHSVSKLIWEDVVTGEWYYFNHLKFL
jgi:hypothetical protein